MVKRYSYMLFNNPSKYFHGGMRYLYKKSSSLKEIGKFPAKLSQTLDIRPQIS